MPINASYSDGGWVSKSVSNGKTGKPQNVFSVMYALSTAKPINFS